MGNEWKEYRLEDCMEAIIDYRGKTPKKASSGIPLVTAKIVKNGTILPYTEYIAEEDYDIWMQRGLPEPGDVVMTTEAPLGEVAQLDKTKVALAQRIITLRGKTDLLDNTFLRYLLTSRQVQYRLNARSSGTTVRGIKQSELRKIRLQFPSLPEQRRIAHILGTLDDKIALNRQQNATLEAMAQALFRSWFVDFDPVLDKALAAGHDIPEPLQAKAQRRLALGNQRKPLPPEVAGLFPDRFVYEEEVGWVPEGWVVKPLDQWIDINPRISLPKGTDAKYLEMKGLPTTEGYSASGVIKKEYKGGAKFQNGDVLLARITPCLENGKTGIVDFLDTGEIGFGSTEFIVMRGKGGIQTPFVACLARDDQFRKHCIQSMVGSSGRQRVQHAAFSNFHLAIPGKSTVLKAFHGMANQFFTKMTRNSEESEILNGLRDTLLPKLISGELRMPAAESLVEKGI